MSASDPNDPYGPPPSEKQPPRQPGGYPSYPQQSQQPGDYPSYPGSYPGGGAPYGGPPIPPGLPSKANVTRILMFVAGGLQGLFSLLMIAALLAAKDEASDELEKSLGVEISVGVITSLFVIYLIHAAIGVFLAAKFNSGGTGIRVGSIVWASFIILFGVIAIPVGVLWIALGIVCIVFLANQESGAWFNRHQSHGMG